MLFEISEVLKTLQSLVLHYHLVTLPASQYKLSGSFIVFLIAGYAFL